MYITRIVPIKEVQTLFRQREIISGIWRHKNKIIEAVLYVPKRLRVISVRTQKVTWHYRMQLEWSRGSINRDRYNYMI